MFRKVADYIFSLLFFCRGMLSHLVSSCLITRGWGSRRARVGVGDLLGGDDATDRGDGHDPLRRPRPQAAPSRRSQAGARLQTCIGGIVLFLLPRHRWEPVITRLGALNAAEETFITSVDPGG